MPSPRFLALVGPTTSGKTALSIAVAKDLCGEVVSMDSRQVYRGMDVGTDKVSLVERASVPHHGLDLLDPDQRYSAGRFARDARRWIDQIRSRRKVPVFAGGTGFFLRALMEPIFAEPPLEASRLDRLRTLLTGLPRDQLATWVRRLDPVRAEEAVTGGTQRMTRTLEVALLTGRPLSWWHRNAGVEAPGVPGVVVVLAIPREELDRRIAARVDRMLDRGLVDEVARLREAGFGPGDPGMSGTGYREVAGYLAGDTTLEAALESMRVQTRQYSRRQLTWFRHQLPADTPVLDAMAPLDDQIARVRKIWTQNSNLDEG